MPALFFARVPKDASSASVLGVGRADAGRQYAWRPPEPAMTDIGAHIRHLWEGLGLELGIERTIREPPIRVVLWVLEYGR
jgi:hypothetical protein